MENRESDGHLPLAVIPGNFKSMGLIVTRDEESRDFIRKLAEEKIHTLWMFNWVELLYSKMDYVDERLGLSEIERRAKEGLGAWTTEYNALILVLTTGSSWGIDLTLLWRRIRTICGRSPQDAASRT